jgi:cell division protein FtsI/penicillin-binding protein 2
MACMVSALANDGKILQPRLVARIEPQGENPPENSVTFAAGVVRGESGVNQRSVDLVREAMLADVEHPDGTGHRSGFISGYRICAKTGTAKLERESVTWFVSFAPLRESEIRRGRRDFGRKHFGRHTRRWPARSIKR